MIEVADAFNLGRVQASQVVMRGAMGEISRLDTSRGSFAVKELFAWNSGEGVETEAQLTQRARQLGLAVPEELRTRTGSLVAEVAGVRWRAYEWLDLEPERIREPRLVGEAVAALHRNAVSDDRPLDSWYEVPPSPAEWDELIGSSGDEPWGPELEELRGHLLDLSFIRRPSAPRMTCHRDLEPDNVLPLASGGLAVLDWENAGPLELDQELGCVLLWCPDALDVYSDTVGRRVAITPESFATAASVWLNFIAVQARTALDGQAAMQHREYARAALSTMLKSPLVVPGAGAG